jgi:putative hydrolase of the HAD superfamily
MNHIKHFSFDLWFTLIKSNPAFKKERALYFHRTFNSINKSIEEVELVFRNVDLMCNAINEQTGKNISSEEMYLMVIYQLNNSPAPFGGIDIGSLYKEMEALIFKYNPTVFNPQTISCLERIKQNPDTTLNILSNTAFIKGSTLRTVIEYLQLSKYFDFQIYSDETGTSKPNAAIFNILFDNIYSVRKSKDISLSEILHVGDNPIADIAGAESVGISAFQINSNDKLITNLFN